MSRCDICMRDVDGGVACGECCPDEEAAVRREQARIADMLRQRAAYIRQHATGRAPEVNEECALELEVAANSICRVEPQADTCATCHGDQRVWLCTACGWARRLNGEVPDACDNCGHVDDLRYGGCPDCAPRVGLCPLPPGVDCGPETVNPASDVCANGCPESFEPADDHRCPPDTGDDEYPDDDDPGCVLGAKCCCPHVYHTSDECFTAEDAAEFMSEEEDGGVL
jgi:hypothetical protein